MRPNSRIVRNALGRVARAFGERIRIEPRIPAELTDALPDPHRPAIDAVAVVTLTPEVANYDGARQGKKTGTFTRFDRRRAQAWLAPGAYAAIGYAPRAGDVVKLIDRPAEPQYTIARDPLLSDRGDCSLHLVQDGDAT